LSIFLKFPSNKTIGERNPVSESAGVLPKDHSQ
jgi:hypothetical protein